MGNKQIINFSTVTQPTFDADKYSGMWYQIYNSNYKEANLCSKSIAFYFPLGDKLSMTTYCIADDKITNQQNHTAWAPNAYDPCKFVVKTQNGFYAGEYWIYYTDYTTYSIVGNGKPNINNNGSDFFIMSRKPHLEDNVISEIKKKVIKYGLGTYFT